MSVSLHGCYPGIRFMALQIGDIVGDYEIVGVLGKGGMGTVFRVRNLLSDRIEAMKVALPDLNADPVLADRFLREIRLHASLEHPNIAALRTALRIDNQVLMIMELVEGVSLDQRLRQGPVDVKSSIRYIDQLLSALDLAHSRGIIHRDIKPANIIVTPGESVKLTDFGIARSASDRSLTASGMTPGSLYYMSPEQVQAQPADPRSDLYSLGLTFYEMVTGKRAIQGGNEFAVLNAHLNLTPAPPESVNPDVPIVVGVIIMKALAKQPNDRFQTAAEFRDALRLTEGCTTLNAITEPAATIQRTTTSVTAAKDPAHAQIEKALLKSVGPIAKILMARISPQCSTIDELRDRLSAQITDPTDRAKFLQNASATPTGSASHTSVIGRTPAENTQWDPLVLANAKQHLAVYAGPIASVIVDRAARKARTTQELYQLLAAEIASERDRAAFLKRAPLG
jgi:serine/threonine protein kinase